jgi:predicted ATPase/DNA-binding SARP family transcriptional activator
MQCQHVTSRRGADLDRTDRGQHQGARHTGTVGVLSSGIIMAEGQVGEGAVGAEADAGGGLHLLALGPLEAHVDGTPVALGGQRQRVLLAALLCARDRPLTTDQLVQAVWGDEPPPSAIGSLQAYLSRLRRLLGPQLIVRESGGYALRVAPGVVDVDVDAFERDLATADADRSCGDLEAVAAHCLAALARWRGERFLGELGAEPFAVAEAARLEGLRRHAFRTQIDAMLELGHHDTVIGQLESWLHAEPYDEHMWAQLMIAYHRGGRPLDALQTYRRADRRLRDDLGIPPGRRLRDLQARILAQDPTLATRVGDRERHATAPHPTNLRDTTTSFVGRDDELDQLVEQLTSHRLVTLVGTGGVGKTRLAIEAGWRLLPDVAGGVWDLDLAPIADASTVARPLALALGVPYRAGEAGLAGYVARIGDRPTLLLLDNCEHQLDAAGALTSELLLRCPGLRVLATSQQALGLEGERTVPVAPLSTEDGTALELFSDRTQAVVPGFQVTTTNRASIEQILRRLDGLPLAIELAAATLDLLTPQLLADRLAASFADLHDPSGTDPRHATLHATIDWSYGLLDGSEQRLLERLAVLAGPFDEAAAVAVGTAAQVEAQRIPAALASLAHRSLLSAAPPAADGSPRWRLLEVVRLFGRARLAARAELEQVRSRHLDHLCHVVATAAAHLHGRDQQRAVARLREVDADLDLALMTAAENGDRARLRSLVEGAWLWWYLDERHDDALRWLDAVAADPHAPPRLLAAGALVHGVQLDDTHRRQAVERALAAMARIDGAVDRPGQAYVQLLVGDALTRSPQRFDEAARQLDAAIEHFARHGPAWAEGWALLRRIRVDGLRNADLAVATTRLIRATQRLEAAGDRQLLAYAQLITANIARLDGTLNGGLEAISAAIRSYEELGYVLPLREARHLEALLLTELGRLDEACARFQAQATEAEETGSSTGRFFAALGLAEVQARRGELEPAREALEHLLAAEDGHDPGVAGPLLVVLAPVAGLLARSREEVEHVQHLGSRLLAAWGDGPVPWHEVRAHLAVAEAALAVGQHSRAARELDEAVSIAARIGAPHHLAEVAEGRAVLAAADGDDLAVLRWLGAAARLRAQTGAAPWRDVDARNAALRSGAATRLDAEAARAAWRRGERAAATGLLDEARWT